MSELRIVFDRMPDTDGCRFIEVEDAAGNSINAGQWRNRADGLAELVIAAAPQPPALGGEPEVPTLRYMFRFAACVTTDGPQDWRTEVDRERPAQFLFDEGRVTDFIELVDRAHVARLQAEVERLQEAVNQAREDADTSDKRTAGLEGLLRDLRQPVLEASMEHSDDFEALVERIDAALAEGEKS